MKPSWWIAAFFIVGLISIWVISVTGPFRPNQRKYSPNPTAVPTTNPGYGDLELLGFAGKDILISPGQTYEVSWKHSESVEKFGDEILICLIGFNQDSQEVPAQDQWNEPLCTYPDIHIGGYLISRAKVSDGKFIWSVPSNISSRYQLEVIKFKLRLMVFDNLPPEGRTEWGGNIAGSETYDYLVLPY